MPFDKYGHEVHYQCLQCGQDKEPTEAILCEECMDNFDMVQEAVLQKQLDAIKEGIEE